ncbi:MAG: HYR domain-containing protein [Saprospiraceae bacterium]
MTIRFLFCCLLGVATFTTPMLAGPDFTCLKMTPNSDFLVYGHVDSIGKSKDLLLQLICSDTLDLGPDVILCRDSTVTFHAGSGFATYLWQDGSTDSTYTTNIYGLYSVEVTDSCGQTQRDSVLLTVSLLGDTPFPDTSVCAGETLVASVPGFDNYLWTPAGGLNCDTCASVVLQPTATTDYTILATTVDGCVFRDTFQVAVLPLPTRTEVIEFMPGDTVVLGGVPYTKPDTVILILPAATGCDTAVTYVLQLQTLVTIDCPANLTVSVDAGDTGTIIDYNPPTAVSNCGDPTLTFTLLSGLPVGGFFPVGLTKVCYKVGDACGNADTCCFQLTVEEQAQPCDVKTIGCLRYELLSIKLDALGNRRYAIRVTNTCADALVYTAFELPGSLSAVAPADGSVFTTANGRKYDVRNPNASPFHSIRFKAQAGTLLNLGASDIFTYSLPGQTAPKYIHVTARLESGQTYPALLNTFNCPVQPDQNFQPEAVAERFAGVFTVFPNPTDGALFADCPAWAGQSVQCRVVNAQGQVVHTQNWRADYLPQPLNLPAVLSNGLYFIELCSVEGQRAVQRFTLLR